MRRTFDDSDDVVSKAMTNQRRKSGWQEAASRMLKSEMSKHGFSYKALAAAMDEDHVNLTTRINRGTFSVAFYFEALRTMGTDAIDIKHLPDLSKESAR